MTRHLANFSSTQIPTNEVGVFLNEGLKIQEKQWVYSLLIRCIIHMRRRQIIYACQKYSEHNLQSTKDDIKSRRAKLTLELAKWRKAQARIMAEAGDTIEPQSCELEREKLWLPSDFTESQRLSMGATMIALASEEGKLRQGEAYDLIRRLQSICKTLTALSDRKRLNKGVSGQQQHTIAGEQVLDTQRRRDDHISSYNLVRAAMISLGTCDKDDTNTPFPHLTVSDTFMKSRRRERALGDSRRGDGLLFTNIGIASGSKISHPPAANFEEDEDSSSEDQPVDKRLRLTGEF
jgi:hypothetical protein